MPELADLRVKIFADGADLENIKKLSENPLIKGFTTNPTLMRQAQVRDYRSFAQEALSIVGDLPINFEVFSDDWPDMEKQALEIASWGRNVYVKIPVTNSGGEFSGPLIQRLSEAGVRVNVTALMTAGQVREVANCLAEDTDCFVSLFAGRVADTGRDPVPVISESLEWLRTRPKAELIWASPRELLNIFQADSVGCHVITATIDVLAKLHLVGKDLEAYSLETVQMFRNDAVEAGYSIETFQPAPVPQRRLN